MSEREPARQKTFWVRSMYGAHTKQPIVIITMPGGESTQMRPEEARALALNILEAAEAAEGDGFIVEWSMAKLDLTPEQATILLREFRDWRKAHAAGEDEG
jgi:hypothetical protein